MKVLKDWDWNIAMVWWSFVHSKLSLHLCLILSPFAFTDSTAASSVAETNALTSARPPFGSSEGRGVEDKLLWSGVVGCCGLQPSDVRTWEWRVGTYSILFPIFPFLSLYLCLYFPRTLTLIPQLLSLHSHTNQSIMEEAAVVTTLPLPLLSLSLPHKSIYHGGGSSCNHTPPPPSLSFTPTQINLPWRRQQL